MWIFNESLPIDYYRSCANQQWFTELYLSAGHCSLQDFLLKAKWEYRCHTYGIIYGPKRTLGTERQLALALLMTVPSLLSYAMLGAVNFIIMTRVLQQMNDSSGTLLLHQVEIACDIAMVFPIVIPLARIVNAIKHAITGKMRNQFVGILSVICCCLRYFSFFDFVQHLFSFDVW